MSTGGPTDTKPVKRQVDLSQAMERLRLDSAP